MQLSMKANFTRDSCTTAHEQSCLWDINDPQKHIDAKRVITV